MKHYRQISIVVACVLALGHQSHAQWTQTNGPAAPYGYVWKLATLGNNLYAATDAGVFLSTNTGASWQAVNVGLTDTIVRAFTVSGTRVFAGTMYGGVFVTTDSGATWTARNSGLTSLDIHYLVTAGTRVFAGTSQGVARTTNDGLSWTYINSGLTDKYIRTMLVSGSTLLVSTPAGVFRSSNYGTVWTLSDSGIAGDSPGALMASSTSLFVSTGSFKLFKSTNNGVTWSEATYDLSPNSFNCMAVSGVGIFLGGSWPCVFLSTDDGWTWSAVNSGMPSSFVQDLALVQGALFAATQGQDIWKRPISEMLTGVSNFGSTLPSQPSLAQNYPNPFNPSTSIRFSIAKAAHIVLSVYNVLGERIRTLVNDERPPGQYAVVCDGAGLPSGVYFYQLSAGSYLETRKMLLIR